MHLGIRVSYRKERKDKGNSQCKSHLRNAKMEEARSLMSFKVSSVRVGAPQAPSCPKTTKNQDGSSGREMDRHCILFFAGRTAAYYILTLAGSKETRHQLRMLLRQRHFVCQTSFNTSYPLSVIVTSLLSSL